MNKKGNNKIEVKQNPVNKISYKSKINYLKIFTICHRINKRK